MLPSQIILSLKTKTIKKVLLSLVGLTAIVAVSAQDKIKDGTVTGTGTIPEARAILELESSWKGFLLPRFSMTSTTTWPTSGSSTAGPSTAGYLAYNTNAAITGSTTYPTISGGLGLYYWDGSGWVATKPAVGNEPWNIQKTMTGATANSQNITQRAAVSIMKDSSYIGSNGMWANLDVNGPVRFGGRPLGDVGVNSFGAGDSSIASGRNSFAFGQANSASGDNSMAGGYHSAASGSNSFAWGYADTTSASSGIVFGWANKVGLYGDNGVVFGDHNTVQGVNQYNVLVSGRYNTLHNGGEGAILGGDHNIITASGSSDSYNSVILGGLTDTIINARNAVVLGGEKNYASGKSSIVSGYQNRATAEQSFAGGVNTIATGTNGFAYGGSDTASNINSAAFGEYNNASGWASVAFGQHNRAIGTSAAVFGQNNVANLPADFVAGIGSSTGNTAGVASQIALGEYAFASGYSAVGIGDRTSATGKYSVAVGTFVKTNNNDETAYGHANLPFATNNSYPYLAYVGDGYDVNSRSNMIVIQAGSGWSTNNFSNNWMAIGSGSATSIAQQNGEKVRVYGKVNATGYSVNTTNLNVPDYVFQQYYKGKSSLNNNYKFNNNLYAVEDYLKKNNHLPGVTSALEIKKAGFYNLEDMQMQTLEKTEELYLHVIEQQKTIDTQKDTINSLQNTLKAVIERLNKLEGNK